MLLSFDKVVRQRTATGVLIAAIRSVVGSQEQGRTPVRTAKRKLHTCITEG